MNIKNKVEITLANAQTIEAKPGDIVVLTFKGKVTDKAVTEITTSMKSMLPQDVEVLILDEGTTISILRDKTRFQTL